MNPTLMDLVNRADTAAVYIKEGGGLIERAERLSNKGRSYDIVNTESYAL
jgi:hypothetical protein